jgi:potassium-transporting ATPase KdpC subunit
MHSLLTSLRVTAATMAVCVGLYATAVWAISQTIVPDKANGSLIVAGDGTVIGSRQIAQAFNEPRYFWPRPSAVDYNGAGAGGSNWSPTSPDVAARGQEMVERYGATPENPLPADLAAASGAGLDPHISQAAALYQVARVAEARGLDPEQVTTLVRGYAVAPGGFLGPDRIVNVLELNIALDRL